MKQIFFALCLSVGLAACSGTDKGSPTATLDAMFTAMKNGQVDDFKKFITKADVTMIESMEKFANSIDAEAIDKMKTKMGEEFKKKAADITYTFKNEKVDGDKATVDAEITDDGKTESHKFNLVKEDGAWKISLLNSDSEMFNSMKGNLGPDHRDIEDGLERLKNMDPDSLKMMLNKGVEMMEKMDSLKNASKK